MPPASPSEPGFRAPHPLAAGLIARLRDVPGARVLEIGTGSGRNAAALAAAGIAFASIGEAAPIAPLGGGFSAALSTHALLHGTPASLALRLAEIRAALAPHGLFAATFGSTRDARFGRGEPIDPWTYAPREGDESGVPHAFFDGARLHELLDGFVIERIAETRVDEIAGKWAHERTPLRGAVHWFVEASVQ